MSLRLFALFFELRHIGEKSRNRHNPSTRKYNVSFQTYLKLSETETPRLTL